MSNVKDRLLSPEYIPNTLWDDASRTLLLPETLTNVYIQMINQHGLLDLAEHRDPNNPPVGGMDEARTNQHFAQAFDGSAARAQLALLDPICSLSMVSNGLIQSLSGNCVCLTDAPCGAGATTIALLTDIAEMRAQGILPRYPLEVNLIAAEISSYALKYASEIFEKIQPLLETQAIFITKSFLSWDATDSLSNTDLIKKITITSTKVTHTLLIISNFNSFLEKERKRKSAQPQIEELFRHASGRNSLAIWIEPDMNRATQAGGLFHWLGGLIRGTWHRFVRQSAMEGQQYSIAKSSARFRLPLQTDKSARVGLAVMRLDLERSP